MHTYMKQFNTTKSSDGVKQVRNGNLDAFIYDAVVLDYMAGQDPDCRKLYFLLVHWKLFSECLFRFSKISTRFAKEYFDDFDAKL